MSAKYSIVKYEFILSDLISRIAIISALISFLPGCSQDNQLSTPDEQTNGTKMDDKNVEYAAKTLAESIKLNMEQIRNSTDASDIYAVVLVVYDDFSGISVFANTAAHFAASEGKDLDRYYFGGFKFDEYPVDYKALKVLIGEVDDWGEDEVSENSNSVNWLVAMTYAMRYAKEDGAFMFGGKNAIIYCSMVDSRNATWLEDLSARFLNDNEVYAASSGGIKAASADWYQTKNDQNVSQLRSAYEVRLK